MDNLHFMSPIELSAKIGLPDAPQIFDVCLDDDHALDPRVIPTSQRIHFAEAADRILSDHALGVVIVCQKGFKLSQGVAASIRNTSGSARALQGGRVAWAEADLPMWPCAISDKVGQVGSAWAVPIDVTPSDVLAAWVIARFVDPAARWWHVARDQTNLVADRFSAGRLALAGDLCALEGPLQHPLQELSRVCHTEQIRQMLAGYCQTYNGAPNWIERIFPALDGLWANITRGVAQ